jgi:hypothetical protein
LVRLKPDTTMAVDDVHPTMPSSSGTMADSNAPLDLKKLTLLHELMAAQLELMVTEQARQHDLLEDVKRQIEPLRDLPALVRTVLENQTRR